LVVALVVMLPIVPTPALVLFFAHRHSHTDPGPISPPRPTSPQFPKLVLPSYVRPASILYARPPFRCSSAIPIPALELVSMRPILSQARAIASSFPCSPCSSVLSLLPC
jgi:hypothetical protein